MSGLFTRLARKARGADIGAARLVVATPYEAEAPAPMAVEQAAAIEGGERAAAPPAGPASAAAQRAARQAAQSRASEPERPAPAPETRAPDAALMEQVRRAVTSLAVAEQVGEAAVEPPGVTPAAARAAADVAAAPDDGPLAPPVARRPTATTAAAGEAAAATRGRAAIAAERPVSGPSARARAVPAEASDPTTPLATLDDPLLGVTEATDTADADDGPLLGPVPRRPSSPRMPTAARRNAGDPATADAATARPIVRVTIGRVDVRGAPAAASPPSRTPPARHQAQSLEEYLRRRDGSTSS